MKTYSLSVKQIKRLIEEARKTNEGPGAGYEIEFEDTKVYATKYEIDREKKEIKFTLCPLTVSASGYDWGTEPTEYADQKATLTLYLDSDSGKDLFEEYNVNDLEDLAEEIISSNIILTDISYMHGGGYVHVPYKGTTWDGSVAVDGYSDLEFVTDDKEGVKAFFEYYSEDFSAEIEYVRDHHYGDEEEYEDEYLTERGKRGFVKKFKNGCYVIDAGDVFVVCDPHGKNIGQERTLDGCEAIADEYDYEDPYSLDR